MLFCFHFVLVLIIKKPLIQDQTRNYFYKTKQITTETLDDDFILRNPSILFYGEIKRRMGSKFQIKLLSKTESLNYSKSIIELVNEAFMEDAFFKIPEKRQRLKIDENDLKGIEDIHDILKVSEFIACFDEQNNNEMLGCIRVEISQENPKLASFGMLSVPKRHSCQGIGKNLVLAAEDWARNRACTWMEISVVNIRIPVMEFYKKLGYYNKQTIVGEESEIDFDVLLGGQFLSEEYKGIVKFVFMKKDLL